MSVIEWDKRISLRADRKKAIEEAAGEIWTDVISQLPESGHIGIDMQGLCPKIIIKDGFYDLKNELSAISAETEDETIKQKLEEYNELVRLYDNVKSSPEEIFEALDDIAQCEITDNVIKEAVTAAYKQLNNIYGSYRAFSLTAEAYDKLQPALKKDEKAKGHIFGPDEIKEILAERYYIGHEVTIYYRQLIKDVNPFKLMQAVLAAELFKAAFCLSSFICFGDTADNIFCCRSSKPHQLVLPGEREAIFEGLSLYFAYSWCESKRAAGYRTIALNMKAYWEKHLVYGRSRWQRNAIENTGRPIWAGAAAALIDNSDQAALILDASLTGGPGGNLYHARFLMLVVPKRDEEYQENN